MRDLFGTKAAGRGSLLVSRITSKARRVESGRNNSDSKLLSQVQVKNSCYELEMQR